MKTTRRTVQFAFLALTLVGVFVFEANCERWCPFGGVEAVYEYATKGTMICSLSISNFYILGGVVLMTLLLRRAFCGYMCPIGTISEWLNCGARRLGLKTFRVPPKVDRTMALLKYVVLGVILVTTWYVGELIFRSFDPCYALISRHGTDITYWAYVVAGAIVIASLVLVMPFCRWFCPLAAVLNPLSRFGLTCVKRDTAECVDCAKCSEACPMAIPVDQLEHVTAGRCISCLNCVDVCPKKESGALSWGPPPVLGGRWPQTALVAVLLLCTTAAVSASYLFPVPSYVKIHGTRPDKVASVRLELENLSCRGRANLLFFFLERDDMYQVPDYFRLEAWPGPGTADIRVFYDPTQTDEQLIKQAITEPYFDPGYGWRESPFTIEGYDILGPGLPDGMPVL